MRSHLRHRVRLLQGIVLLILLISNTTSISIEKQNDCPCLGQSPSFHHFLPPHPLLRESERGGCPEGGREGEGGGEEERERERERRNKNKHQAFALSHKRIFEAFGDGSLLQTHIIPIHLTTRPASNWNLASDMSSTGPRLRNLCSIPYPFLSFE